MGFFPSNYDSESLNTSSGGGQYFKPQDGKNKIRICSDAIFGWLYWTVDNKPARSAKHPGANPPGIRTDDRTGRPERVKPFLAVVVWDYASNGVAIWEVTQATIMRALEDLVHDEDWGDPKGYDITINRTGKGLETSYSLLPSTKKAIPADVLTALDATPINLTALYAGDNPFGAAPTQTTDPAEDELWEQFRGLLTRAGDDANKLKIARNWAVQRLPEREAEIDALISIPF